MLANAGHLFRSAISNWQARLLISIAWGVTGLLLIAPVCVIVWFAVKSGSAEWMQTLSSPETISALKLTLLSVLVAIPLNILFGLACSWLLVMCRCPGRRMLELIVSLPLFVSPVVAGLMLVLLFGRGTLLGYWLETHNMQIVFHVSGILLVTVFVTCPYIVKELVPVMEEWGSDREETALLLGAKGWSLFRHITFPGVRHGLFYGVLLCNARALGEFGAVSVVSGHIRGETLTLPLQIEQLYDEYNTASAFIVATLLVLLALLMLVLKSVQEWREKANAKPEEPR
ncbi:sulfate ABC transporter permease [Endozoicomonadaceae bacterium StTr2]